VTILVTISNHCIW